MNTWKSLDKLISTEMQTFMGVKRGPRLKVQFRNQFQNPNDLRSSRNRR